VYPSLDGRGWGGGEPIILKHLPQSYQPCKASAEEEHGGWFGNWGCIATVKKKNRINGFGIDRYSIRAAH